MENTFAQLRSILEEDAQRPFPKYPEVAVHLLSDSRVEESVQRRLENDGQLVNVASLGYGYSFYTGLQPICFEFSSVRGSPLRNDAFLVVADFDCGVVGIVDPYNPPGPRVGRTSGFLLGFVQTQSN